MAHVAKLDNTLSRSDLMSIAAIFINGREPIRNHTGDKSILSFHSCSFLSGDPERFQNELDYPNVD